MNQLLVLTDFSAAADNALAYAAQLAQPLRAGLLLLHVRRTSLLDPEALTGKYPARTEAEARALLQQQAAHWQQQGIACTGQVAAGDVTEEFVAAARAHGVLLAVASKCDTEELPDELVNSTVLRLLRHTPCPLLVVPEAYRQHALPLHWLVALDEQPAQLGALATAVQPLLEAGHPLVQGVQVIGEGQAMSPAHPANLATALGAEAPVQVLPGSDVALVLTKRARQQLGSWLVLWARSRSRLSNLFHRSRTAAVVLHSPVPVLVLPEAAA
ncbi:nucleotide-binding universal stress UspA family protein [Hymenobacter luteus]|uniref:Nucleotide-binding universal stress UspA family protein n=2 Tax=Hymenobacter TaxID=89966 RepID=A0A7W9WE49_9BACT|nr:MULTISPECIES: universal stress protein [Hymenobacter]MBB4603426.1 nucleotide-binding universal stress UspA family protein [Hymenobacter latericoloratus]MBB6061220.1 nucleotide-binding universal stress UspA family protein [Hymenobacter luteus]